MKGNTSKKKGVKTTTTTVDTDEAYARELDRMLNQQPGLEHRQPADTDEVYAPELDRILDQQPELENEQATNRGGGGGGDAVVPRRRHSPRELGEAGCIAFQVVIVLACVLAFVSIVHVSPTAGTLDFSPMVQVVKPGMFEPPSPPSEELD